MSVFNNVPLTFEQVVNSTDENSALTVVAPVAPVVTIYSDG